MMYPPAMYGHEMCGWWTGSWPLFAVGILLWVSVWGLLMAALGLAVRWLWQQTSRREEGGRS
jgi:hypothetical protein